MGVRDNRPFLAAILRHPVFACGEATTAFIGEDFADDASMAGESPSSQLWALAALLRCEAETPSADLRGWHSSTLGAQPVQLRCGDHEQTVYIRYQDNHAELIVGENSHRIATLAPGLATIDGVQQRYRMCQDGKQSWLQWQGHSVCFEDATHSAAGTSDQAGSGQIRAPMDGAVIEVCAKAGDAVKRGQVLVIMEAMKMEHSLKADCDGTVESADLAVGSQVKRQQLLVSIKPDSPET